MKISKSSSLSKSRIRSSYGDRNTQDTKTTGVDAIDPIKKIQNSSFYSSENHLMSYDGYYDSLKELKKEYRRFYRDEQNLEEAIKDLTDNKDELINNMENLISKYNQAIKSLKEFDKTFNCNNVLDIINVLKSYEKELNNLGIYIVKNIELEMNREIFIDEIEKSENALDFLFKPAQGLILKLHFTFRNIKLPRKDSVLERFTNSDLKGSILDNKM